MNKYDCFNYIKANHPDEFYTIPIPHGDLRRTVARGISNCRASIPSSWTTTMAPITGAFQDWFLCVNETLEPKRSFTNRRACVEWVINNTLREVTTVALPLGDPRRKVNNGKYVGCVPPASWTVLINPENTIRGYEQESDKIINVDKFLKYARTQNPKDYAARCWHPTRSLKRKNSQNSFEMQCSRLHTLSLPYSDRIMNTRNPSSSCQSPQN